jgi:hypothetical protein
LHWGRAIVAVVVVDEEGADEDVCWSEYFILLMLADFCWWSLDEPADAADEAVLTIFVYLKEKKKINYPHGHSIHSPRPLS